MYYKATVALGLSAVFFISVASSYSIEISRQKRAAVSRSPRVEGEGLDVAQPHHDNPSIKNLKTEDIVNPNDSKKRLETDRHSIPKAKLHSAGGAGVKTGNHGAAAHRDITRHGVSIEQSVECADDVKKFCSDRMHSNNFMILDCLQDNEKVSHSFLFGNCFLYQPVFISLSFHYFGHFLKFVPNACSNFFDIIH